MPTPLARDFWQSYRVIRAGFTDFRVLKQLDKGVRNLPPSRVGYANSKQPQRLTIRDGPRDQCGMPCKRLPAPFAIRFWNLEGTFRQMRSLDGDVQLALSYHSHMSVKAIRP